MNVSKEELKDALDKAISYVYSGSVPEHVVNMIFDELIFNLED